MPESPISIAVLGATGSIGRQALAELARFPERFRVVGLGAGQQADALAELAIAHSVRHIALADAAAVPAGGFPAPLHALTGPDAMAQLVEASGADWVLVGITGMAGLAPTLAALALGKTVLTANKETFVTGGHLVQPYLDQVRSLDSEHVAIHQCLKGTPLRNVHRLLLTASGGPFRTWPAERIARATVAEALAHPNWRMGPKISVDSATMMNKGLEILEARWLFDVPVDQIEVVVHPQSVIHSGVALVDGSVLFQAAVTDMRVAIRYALGFPERLPVAGPADHLTLSALSQLTFEPPDEARFPCLGLARAAGALGPGGGVVLNAADEVAVAAFLQERIAFSDIPSVIERSLEAYQSQRPERPATLAAVQALDAWARAQAEALCSRTGLSVGVRGR